MTAALSILSRANRDDYAAFSIGIAMIVFAVFL